MLANIEKEGDTAMSNTQQSTGKANIGVVGMAQEWLASR